MKTIYQNYAYSEPQNYDPQYDYVLLKDGTVSKFNSGIPDRCEFSCFMSYEKWTLEEERLDMFLNSLKSKILDFEMRGCLTTIVTIHHQQLFNCHLVNPSFVVNYSIVGFISEIYVDNALDA